MPSNEPAAAGAVAPGIAWLRAASSGPAVELLESIYADLRREVAARAPVCRTSGRCCNFDSWGHRLYVTGLEAAYAWARLEASRRPGLDEIASARRRGGCPFQSELLCTIHAIKPLGCRVYFCDQSAQHWQQEVYERLFARIRSAHEIAAVPYIYAEWRDLLDTLAGTPGAAAWPSLNSTIGDAAAPVPGFTGVTIDRRETDRLRDAEI